MRLGFVAGTKDIRVNEEAFVLTPFFYFVQPHGYRFKFYGIGICWGWWAIYFAGCTNWTKEASMFMWLGKIKSKNQ